MCLGQEDESLLDAWQLLSDITPPEQLNDLFVFAGFEPEMPLGSPVTLYLTTKNDVGSSGDST